MSLVRKLLFILVLVAICWSIYLYTRPEKDTLPNYLFGVYQGIVYLIGATVGLVSVRTMPPSYKRSSILFLSLGAVSWAIAAFIWAYFNIFSKVDIPQPSIADALYMSYSILTGVGCWYLLKTLHNNKKVGDLAKPFVIIFMVFFAGMIALGWPEVFVGDSVLKVVINLQYPITDGFLFALAYVTFLQEHSTYRRIIVLLVLSMFFQVLGDVNYLILESFGIYWNGSFPDVLYMASAFVSSFMLTYFVEKKEASITPTSE